MLNRMPNQTRCFVLGMRMHMGLGILPIHVLKKSTSRRLARVPTSSMASSIPTSTSASTSAFISPTSESLHTVAAVDALLAQQLECLLITCDQKRTILNATCAGDAIVSGSFNPLHKGHVEMAHAAQTALSTRVVFEMSVSNADKGNLDRQEIFQRISQFNEEIGFDLLLTRAPYFVHKATVVPNAKFVVGFDTACRIVDPKYYNGSQAGVTHMLSQLKTLGTTIVVVGRVEDPASGTGKFLTLVDVPNIPERFADLFVGLTEEEFRVDLSSSQLRNQSPQI
eukprot:m.90412 g.90412  ORF g.90412 m.90412 type:complete len:282 (-) comp26395_c0_seq1:41-886(-)